MASRDILIRSNNAQAAQNTTPLIDRWHYTGGKRDLRLDLLRGLAALAMIIDHVGGKESLLYSISGGDRFFVSAAEGFVFISGLVMGIVYAGVIARSGLRAGLIKAARRTGTMYMLTVTLSLLFAGLSYWFGLSWAPNMADMGPGQFVLSILTLRRAFYLTDVLLLYTLVIAVSLPVFALMRRGYTWLALAGSWGLWATWQLWPQSVQLPWVVEGSDVFHFSAWQVLFISGLALCYHRKSIEQGFSRVFRQGPRRAVQFAVFVVCAIVVGGSVAAYSWLETNHTGTGVALQLGQLFSKSDLGPGRLALFGCLFTGAYFLCTLAWLPIKKALGWLLLPLGQDALLAYTLHLFAIAILAQVGPMALGAAAGTFWGNTLVQAAGVVAIWAAISAKARAAAFLAMDRHRFGSGFAAKTGRYAVAAPTRRCALPVKGPSITAPVPRQALLQRIGRARPVRASLAGLSMCAVILVSGGPVLAGALSSGVNSVAPASFAATTLNALVMPTAGPSTVSSPAAAPTSPAAGGAMQTTSDFAMLFSGTAVPLTSATATPVVLPSYVQQRTFQSATLNRAMPYSIFLPPGYDTSTSMRYPVLYMLHGISGTNTEWLGYGLLGRAHDMMVAGQIAQFIIVLPQGDQGYWVDQANGPQWGTYASHDVVADVDQNFRTLADPHHRAIGGLSMGGYAALVLAITGPTIFGVAGADSPSLHTYASAPRVFGDEAYFNAHDPVHLYAANPSVARTLKLYIDVGQQDSWLPVVESFHKSLLDNGVAHDWHPFPGAHEGTYWSTHVPDYLFFYSSAFSAPPGAPGAGSGLSPGAGGSVAAAPVRLLSRAEAMSN